VTGLVIGGLLFLGTHLGLSSGLRGTLTAALGERRFLLLYTVIAFATLGYLIYAYVVVEPQPFAWAPRPVLHWVPVVAMPLALILLVGAFMTRNPTGVGMEAEIAGTGSGAGVIRITRHPLQWAVILWASTHIIANGDWASIVFFGTFGILSLFGTVLMDRKIAARVGETAWTPFSSATSNLPFAAIVGGRNRLVFAELWPPILVGSVVYLLLFWAHPWIAGVPVLVR
jgi:uncharacterized membrane protein